MVFYIRAYVGVGVLLNALLTPAVDGGQWPASRSVRLLLEYMKKKMVEDHRSRGRFAGEGNLVALRESSP